MSLGPPFFTLQPSGTMALDNLAATTELEAVNALLRAIGEAPIASLGSGQPDEDMALSILEAVMKEVLSEGWRFNTEIGHEIAPEASTYDWVDSAGETTTLNIFLPPADLLDFQVANVSGQEHLDLLIRKADRYPDGSGTGETILFYDRIENRDGLDEDDHPYLYIDIVRFMDWSVLPEVARRYIVAVAARRFRGTLDETPTTLPFTDLDVRKAYRQLIKSEGTDRNRNIFNHPDAWEGRGRRAGRSYHFTRLTTRR